jgi:hypothetical protein
VDNLSLLGDPHSLDADPGVRSLVLAVLAILPTMLSVALVLGLMGSSTQARHGHGLVAGASP